jgi:hypothetical protein
MGYRLAADAVLVIHLVFIVFVVFGALLCLWRAAIAFVHLPAAAWGAFVELTGRVCPLTVWENDLRRLAGGAGYTSSFVDHHLLPLVYPAGLTTDLQTWLGAAVIAINAALYGWVLYRHRAAR